MPEGDYKFLGWGDLPGPGGTGALERRAVFESVASGAQATYPESGFVGIYTDAAVRAEFDETVGLKTALRANSNKSQEYTPETP